jgi:hypothetical protein
LGIAWLAALALGGATIVFENEAHVASQIVTLEDVADLSILPAALYERARTIEIASFPRAGHRLTLSTGFISERARAQLPALAAWLPQGARESVIVERRLAPAPAQPKPAAPRSCAHMASAVEAGATPLAADFAAAAPCDETALDHAFRYDASARVVRATMLLDAGALVEIPPMGLLAGVREGDPISLAIRVGPVVVERSAAVAKPARAEERVFVRTDDNEIFAVPHPEAAP